MDGHERDVRGIRDSGIQVGPGTRRLTWTGQDAGPAGVPAPRSWVEMQSGGAPTLEVLRGPGCEPGTQFVLEAEVTEVGRHPECGIVLDHPTVSRHHAEVRHEGRRVVLRDLGSLNGTYVNRETVDSAVLGEGDEIWIGTFRLVFHEAAAS